jgi:hypothetical protein
LPAARKKHSGKQHQYSESNSDLFHCVFPLPAANFFIASSGFVLKPAAQEFGSVGRPERLHISMGEPASDLTLPK